MGGKSVRSKHKRASLQECARDKSKLVLNLFALNGAVFCTRGRAEIIHEAVARMTGRSNLGSAGSAAPVAAGGLRDDVIGRQSSGA